MTEIFGTFVDGAQVEDAVLGHLQQWLPTYLYEMERQRSLAVGYIAQPAFWSVTPNQGFDFLGEEKTPAILVMSPGVAGTPAKEGDGAMRTSWVVGVGAVVSARDENSTRLLARWYAAAIRGVMLQKVPLAMRDGLHWHGVQWEDEGYDDLPGSDTRSLASARLLFTLDFRGVVNTRSGPATPTPANNPDSPAYPDDPTVRSQGSAPPYTSVPPTTRSH